MQKTQRPSPDALEDKVSVRIVEVREREGVARLQQEWRALQARCPAATPFQTWEWNEAWWRHFGARKRLRLLLFRAGRSSHSGHASSGGGGELVGIAPLYSSFHLGTPLRRLAWMGTGPSDYLGPLALPEAAEEVAAALLAYLDRSLRGWDIADLQQLRPEAPLLAHAARPWSHRPAQAQVTLPMEPCPYLPLPETWEQFDRALSKKLRSNLGYYERLVQKTFPDTQTFLADADTLDTGMTALFDLHQRRWNARWLPGALGSKRVQAFHRDVAARFLERGWLRLHLMRVDGALRSALYCYAFGGRTYYYLGGFAPELAKFSLGTLLTAQAIRQAICEGSAEFDFLRGQEPYKYRWQPEERINARLLLLRSREKLGGLGELPGRAGFALNRVERFVIHRAKAFAEHQGRKTRTQEKEGKAASGMENAPLTHAVVPVRKPRENKAQPR
jgi:CelD/BcsL family acetyltransferase involved in cellulose biosynthesis